MRHFFFKNNFTNFIPLVSSKPGLFYYLTLIVFCFNFSTCSYKSNDKIISEGEIEYNIEYLDNNADNPLIMLLPKKMTTLFKDNSSYTLIEGFLGTFKLIYINSSVKHKNYSLFQMMDKKYYYEAESNDLSFGYQNMKNMKIVFTKPEKKISGYDCKQAIASFPGEKNNKIKIYYTQDINLKKPNMNNPFHDIDGVLMEFTVNLMGINMNLKSRKVSSKKLDPQIFEIPNGYTKAPR